MSPHPKAAMRKYYPRSSAFSTRLHARGRSKTFPTHHAKAQQCSVCSALAKTCGAAFRKRWRSCSLRDGDWQCVVGAGLPLTDMTTSP